MLFGFIVSVSVLLAAGATAFAQSVRPTAEETLVQELAGEAQRARTWRYVWTGINAGSAVVSVAAIPLLPKSERPDLIVGAATSVVSGAVTWFWPLDVESDAESAAQYRSWPRSEQLPRLIRLRAHSAQDEADRVRWPWHLGNLVTAVIPGAILWFGFDRPLSGALTAAGGFASGEIELFTQPTRLADHALVVRPNIGVMALRGGVLFTASRTW